MSVTYVAESTADGDALAFLLPGSHEISIPKVRYIVPYPVSPRLQRIEILRIFRVILSCQSVGGFSFLKVNLQGNINRRNIPHGEKK